MICSAGSHAAISSTGSLHQFQSELAALVDQVSPAVVSITSKQTVQVPGRARMPFGDDFFNMPFGFGMPQQPSQPESRTMTAEGSGVIVKSDGYILTNDHVVGGAQKVTVKLKDGREFDGTVSRDPKSDLAIVKINAKDLPAAKLGDSAKLRVGAVVLAIGSPYELDQTVTMGIVSGVARSQSVSEGSTQRYYPNLVQTDASINPGNSGGPLINIDGEVIGINTLIASPNGGNIGIGFAIPSRTAKFVMDQLIAHGKVTRGYLGITPVDLTPKQADVYGVKEGALVKTVASGSPADKAGIQVEDVLVQIADLKIKNALDLRDAVNATAPGSTIKVVVFRNKAEKTISVDVEEPPSGEAAVNQVKLGFAVANVSQEAIDQYKLEPGTKGVIITSVEQNSDAAAAGLQEGMLIVRANDKAVKTVDDFADATKTLKTGDTLRLVVKVKDSRILIELPVQ
jgi:Do/DeqQ family serine protease